MSKVAKPKPLNPYIISKRSPTQINHAVKPIIHEEQDSLYIASGNLILVYSLTTGILVKTLRSKRQQLGNEKLKGDVHRANIIALNIVQDKVLALCSKGVLSEWDTQTGHLLQFNEINNAGQVKKAVITEEHIALYSSQKKQFDIIDINSKNVVFSVAESESSGKVNQIQLKNKIFAYIKGRQVLVFDIKDKTGKPKVILRDSLLCTLDINDAGSLISVADEFGKIYIIHNTKQLLVQTLHWHAHKVNTLHFIPNSPYLLSAGEEAVIVQWQLETQSKTFISRLGNSILNINLSTPNNTFYAATMNDNSVKVIRFDNNKVQTTIKNLKFENDASNVIYDRDRLVSSYKNDLQFYDIIHKSVQTLKVKPRNYTSSTTEGKEPPSTHVKNFCFTQDGKTLATFEELVDSDQHHKDINIQSLKFWHRDLVQEDVEGFELVQLVQNPCDNEKYGLQIHAIDNSHIVTVNGCEVKVWNQYEQKKWGIYTQFNYQSLKVIQVITDIKLRLEDSKGVKCLALLHKGGVVSYWDQSTFAFIRAFKLNHPSKKIIFEKSHRFLASLSTEGSVEVWKVKGKQEKHWWDLKFKSVTDLQNISSKENQFLLTMNSEDEATNKTDAVLLFQYSRPQNLIMYWKLQLPILKTIFVDSDPSSYLLVINKNFELQTIYFGVTRNDLKNVAEKRRLSIDLKIKESEKVIEEKKQANYEFVALKPERRLSEDRNGGSLQIQEQEIQIRRLDKADKSIRDSDFLGMPSLSYCFEQFAQEMLIKPSKAVNFLDLQQELQNTNQHQHAHGDDTEMKNDANDSQHIYEVVSQELDRVFTNMFK